MSIIPSFTYDSGGGLGVLTIYSALVLYSFVVSPEVVSNELILLLAIGPPLVVYETSKLFTDLLLKEAVEPHIAIARVQAEIQNGGEFDDWYVNETKEEIDQLDEKSRQKVESILCFAIIGLTTPVAGYFAFGWIGIAGGIIVLLISILVIVHILRQTVQVIERFPKVIANEN